MERWPSGWRRTLGKCVYEQSYRGFESHSLRHFKPLVAFSLKYYPVYYFVTQLINLKGVIIYVRSSSNSRPNCLVCINSVIDRFSDIKINIEQSSRRTLGKCVYGKPCRGFESHSLRQKICKNLMKQHCKICITAMCKKKLN